jgi:broad specificity phosphatase PhoE
VLFLGRHGQGWHNVAEAKYGTKAWDVCFPPSPSLPSHQPNFHATQCYFSALNGSDSLVWADAHLTPLGRDQALDAHKLWAQQIPHQIPLPEKFYVSPLTRAIETADITFTHLDLPPEREYKPVVKELAREALGIHTCDRRSPRSTIASAFPHVAFEPGFSEADLLWESDYREPPDARRYRLARFLDQVWASNDVVVSVTSHSGAIASVLEEVGHRRFALETGGVVPVVVRGERVEGKRRRPERGPSDAPEMCDGPPGEEEEGDVVV